MTDAERIAAMKCSCGAVVGLYLSERLNAWVCPPCLDARIEALEDFIANERSRDQIELLNLKARLND